jgi:hypothetical protein
LPPLPQKNAPFQRNMSYSNAFELEETAKMNTPPLKNNQHPIVFLIKKIVLKLSQQPDVFPIKQYKKNTPFKKNRADPVK